MLEILAILREGFLGTEAVIQSQIMIWLKLNNFFVWRNHTQGIRIKGGLYVQNPNVGAPDVMAVKHGMFFGIEVKAGRVGRLAPEQKEWLEKLVAHGGIAIVARSLEDVIEKLGHV